MLELNMFTLDKAELEKDLKIEEIAYKDIAVIGIAGRFPMAQSPEEFWKNLRNGVDCIRKPPESRKKDIDSFIKAYPNSKLTGDYCELGYLDEIDKFDYDFFQISPKEAKLMDPNHRIFMECAWNAMEDSGYGGKKLVGSRTGVYVGFNINDIANYRQYIMTVDPSLGADSMVGNIPSLLPGRIAYLMDFKGPAMVMDTSCSSSLVAIHMACQGIRNGECEMAIAGGVQTTLLPIDTGEKLGIESSDNRTKTFDDRSDGTAGGEAVGAVLLKPLNKALADRDNIYAVVKGTAVNHDGRSIGLTAPSVTAQEDVIVKAWEDAGIAPETIYYIEAHGTGTKLGDPIEIEALQRAFRRYTARKQFCAIGAVKTNVGHTNYAAGIVSFIKAVLALKHKEIPPILHFAIPNRRINFEESPVYVSQSLSEWESEEFPRRCGVSSFGMSGTNCHIILEEAPDSENINVVSRRPDIFTISAKSEKTLKELIKRYASLANRKAGFNAADVCYTANTGRGHYNYRLAFIFENEQDFRDKICKLNFTDNQAYVDKEIYFGRHKIVASAKQKKESGEITEAELKSLSDRAANRIKDFAASGKSDKYILDEICLLYTKGADLEWEAVYKGEKRNRVNIPVYPFERNRCWIETDREKDKDIILIGRGNEEYTEKERLVAEAWAKALGLREINIYDNLFELGADSIVGIGVVADLQKEFDINMNDIFRYSSVSGLAEKISLKKGGLKIRLEELKRREISQAELETHISRTYNEEDKKQKEYMKYCKNYEQVSAYSRKNYKSILLTGSTGYLGAYLLRDLLINTDAGIYLLLRQGSGDSPKDRVIKNLEYYFDTGFYERYKDRINILIGDLTEDYFGWSPSMFSSLKDKIDCIIHSAANTNHYGCYEDFYNINVAGTQRLLEFAVQNLCKDFHYISTTAVASGYVTNRDHMLFTELDCDIGQSMLNHYAATKLEAEKLVSEARGRGLKTNIFRVGNLICDSTNGKFQINMEENAMYSLLKAFVKLGVIPEIEQGALEASFVDYVSKAIILLFDKERLEDETFHIFNPNYINISELGIMLNKTGLILKGAGSLYDIYNSYESGPLKSYLESILLHMGVLDNDSATTVYTITSSKTNSILKKLSFEWCSIEQLYIDRMVQYCKYVDYL